MRGLVKKDLFLIKSNLKFVGIIFIVFAFMALQGQQDLTFLPVFISVVLFMSTFSYDEYNQWNAYAITLPNGRKNIVKSKYLATLILIFLSVLVTVVLSVGIGIVQNHLEIGVLLEDMFSCFCSAVLLQALLYPFIFKFGIEKSRIFFFAGAFGFAAIFKFIISSFQKYDFFKASFVFFEKYGVFLFAFFVLASFLISYKASERIYESKEF